MVRRAHRALVVLDDDHCVAEAPKALQRLDQLLVVPLVQSDRRLIQDVEHADQARADLGGEPDPLRLTARQRPGRAGQVEVADPHVVEEGEPLGDLSHQKPRDRPLGVVHLELLDPLQSRPRRELRVLVDRDPADLDREALRPQPGALAVRAGLLRHVSLDALANPLRVGLLVAPLQVVDDALEPDAVGPPPAEPVRVVDLVPLAAGAVEEDLAVLAGEVLPRGVDVDPVVVRDRFDQPLPVARVPDPPGLQSALAQGERRVRHDQLRVDDALEAEAVAAIAGSVRGVEGEDPRLELRDRGAAVEAGEALGEGEAVGDALRELPRPLRPLDASDVLPGLADRGLARAPRLEHVDLDDPAGQAGGRLDRLGEAPSQVRLHHEAVDHDRDVMVELLVELDLLVQAPQLVVDADAAVALLPELVEQLLELALAAADDRRHHHEARPLLEGHHPVGDLLDGLALDRLAALGAVWMPDPRPEQPQVVVDLGDRADRRARVARGRLLVDRDRRREPVDRVDVRLLHQPEELARVRRERLDVAALALGVDRVEGKARLAGSGEPGHDDQGVARQLEVDVLEVVLARSPDDYAVGRSHYVDDRSRTDVPRSGAPQAPAGQPRNAAW